MRNVTRHYPGINLGSTDRGGHEAASEVVFGFWIFLMSDLVLFALLFATYADMSVHGIAGGPAPHDIVDLTAGFIETALLLMSSFTFGMASLALKYGPERRQLVLWLVVTFVLGAGFIGMEMRDFLILLGEKIAPPQLSGFLSSYWLLVATHGAHVTAGLIWIAIMLIQLGVFGTIRMVKLRLMRLALFWHLLDVVWIGIFTFVFLFGAIS